MQLTQASRQWAKRPDDERFLSLEELKAAVTKRRAESWTLPTPVRQLRTGMGTDGDLVVTAHDTTRDTHVKLRPTHWAFGQLASYARAPGSYLRELPVELAAINLQWGLERNPVQDLAVVLGQTDGDHQLRSMTSTTYGRIWDTEVVDAVININRDGHWQVPEASYQSTDPKRATTLYASDRDVFIFLVDPNHPVEVAGETLFRGFFAWNSEVGSAVFGLKTFLYRFVCNNRIVWGATDVKEIRIKHTGRARDRFADEGQQYLRRYAAESARKTVATIERAKRFELPDRSKGSTWESWLKSRGFTEAQAKAAVHSAREAGEPRSLWDIINGVTASAREIPYTDQRVKLETQAGKLMDCVR
jgi:hypothetical protein